MLGRGQEGGVGDLQSDSVRPDLSLGGAMTMPDSGCNRSKTDRLFGSIATSTQKWQRRCKFAAFARQDERAHAWLDSSCWLRKRGWGKKKKLKVEGKMMKKRDGLDLFFYSFTSAVWGRIISTSSSSPSSTTRAVRRPLAWGKIPGGKSPGIV